MCTTIKHTFHLMKMSWDVLMLDKELLLFPVFSAISLLILVIVFGGLGLLGEVTGGDGTATAESSLQAGMVVFVVLAYIITTFFNASLVSAALERLRGGDPDVGSGLRHALKHAHHLVLWALITATVTIVLMALRGAARRFPIAQILLRMVGGVWEFLTFFVVPVIVAEEQGPISGIKRSASIVRQTWGRQITASFSFVLFYIVAAVIAIVPAVLVGLVNVGAGILLGVVLMATALTVVQTLEGIFKAALYDYAVGQQPQGFDLPTLQMAYRPA